MPPKRPRLEAAGETGSDGRRETGSGGDDNEGPSSLATSDPQTALDYLILRRCLLPGGGDVHGTTVKWLKNPDNSSILYTQKTTYTDRALLLRPPAPTALTELMETTGIYMYGPPGTGKTAWAVKMFPNFHVVTHYRDLKGFNSYRHPGIIFKIDPNPSKKVGVYELCNMLQVKEESEISIPWGYVKIPQGVKRIVIAETDFETLLKRHAAALRKRAFPHPELISKLLWRASTLEVTRPLR